MTRCCLWRISTSCFCHWPQRSRPPSTSSLAPLWLSRFRRSWWRFPVIAVGFCSAYGARRMTETAAHLVEQVSPQVPVRQWVGSFPIPFRHRFATQPHRLSPVLQVIHRARSTFVHPAGLTHAPAQTGAVTLIQQFGSAANLNIHLHCLLLDGVYRLTDFVFEKPLVARTPAPPIERAFNHLEPRPMGRAPTACFDLDI